MTPLRTSLATRREEFDTHYTVARALEDRILAGDAVSIGEANLSVRHLMTIKSGLIIHIYNIFEATMTGVLGTVGRALVSVPPTQWTENALREWLRNHAPASLEGNQDSRLETIHNAASLLLHGIPQNAHSLKKPSGTWSDHLVFTFATRLNVRIRMPPDLHVRLQKQAELADLTPPMFVAKRRNTIAHGRRTFEEGARDLVLPQMRRIADTTFDFLECSVDAFDDYVMNERYKVELV